MVHVQPGRSLYLVVGRGVERLQVAPRVGDNALLVGGVGVNHLAKDAQLVIEVK